MAKNTSIPLIVPPGFVVVRDGASVLTLCAGVSPDTGGSLVVDQVDTCYLWPAEVWKQYTDAVQTINALTGQYCHPQYTVTPSVNAVKAT